jgi:uncharacterized membrane protein YphA (DoxX/SURF4 family)
VTAMNLRYISLIMLALRLTLAAMFVISGVIIFVRTPSREER